MGLMMSSPAVLMMDYNNIPKEKPVCREVRLKKCRRKKKFAFRLRYTSDIVADSSETLIQETRYSDR